MDMFQETYRDREEDEGDEEFIFPYDLGHSKNWLLVFSWNPEWGPLNGIWWPVVKGCNQYTLTVSK